jgi:hypothetical protein
MAPHKPGFINVDELAQQLTVQQVADHFGVPADALQQAGREIRTRCFLQCGKQHDTGDRALAIQSEHPAKIWKCHDYDCPVKQGGNLVSLISLAMGLPVRPRGEDFKRVARLMQSLSNGDAPEPTASPRVQPRPDLPKDEPKVNSPLTESDNERVRAIDELYRKLTVDLSHLPPAASGYVRRHGFLNEDVAARWQVGHLARDAGGDASGGTMRGKFVVAIADRDGNRVAYAGRDPDWETKHTAWAAAGRQGKEPAKWTFHKNFFRGVEVYAQHRLHTEDVRNKLRGIGLPLVEGPLDSINTWETLDVPSVAILSNHATDAQLARIAELANDVSDGTVTLLYDCDEQGERGMDIDAVKLSKLCRVQRAWSRDMHGGTFQGKQPSELTPQDWDVIKSHLIKTPNAPTAEASEATAGE